LTGHLATIYRLGPDRPHTGYNKLDLSFTKVTGRGFGDLNRVNLTHLNISSTLVSDAGLNELDYLDGLKAVFLDYTHLPIEALEHFLKSHQKIENLSLDGATFAYDDLKIRKVGQLVSALKDLKQLTTLDLSHLGIQNNDLDVLFAGENRRNIRRVALSYNNELTNACLTTLVRLEGLQSLYLSGDTELTNLDSLKLNSLEELDLSGTGITNEVLAKMDLPNLKILDISDTKTFLNRNVLFDRSAKWLSERPKLNALQNWSTFQDWSTWLSARPIERNTFWNLKELHVNKTGVSDDELLDIGLLEQLKELDLTETTVTNHGLEQFVRISAAFIQDGVTPRIDFDHPTPGLLRRLEAIASSRAGSVKVSPGHHIKLPSY